MAARKKPQPDWEMHRAEIRKLYLSEDRGLGEIMTHMKQTHGFIATKYQYESQFKAWHLRKYMTREEWDYVHCRFLKRKFDEKESDIYLHGSVIPGKKVKKELARRYTITEDQACAIVSCPTTPEAISISTPQPLIDHAITSYSVSLQDLPWFQFQNLVDITGYSIPNMRNSPSPFWDSFALSEPSELLPKSDPGIRQLFRGWLDPSTKSDGQMSRAPVCILERYDGELKEKYQRLSGPSYRRSLFQILDFGLYYLSNNLLSETQTDNFLTWIIERKYHGLMRSCLEMKMSTVQASATKILESAMRIGDMDFIQGLIDSGIDKSSLKGIYGSRYLVRAARDGHMALARILLDNGVEVNAPVSQEFPYTALQTATQSKHVDMVQVLLKAGAEVNAVAFGSPRDWSAMSSAIDQDSIELVRVLLTAGASVDETIVCGKSALERSKLYGSEEVYQLLVEESEENSISVTVRGILRTAKLGTGDLLQYLARNVEGDNSRVEEILVSALLDAVYRSDENAIRSLLEIGVDPNAETPSIEDSSFEDFAQTLAVSEGHIKIVEILLDAGADLNTPGVLSAAVGRLDPGEGYALMQNLLKEGLDIEIDGGKALQHAALRQNLEMVQLLLDFGADVNEPVTHDPYQGTALQCAVGENAIFRVLLKAGANVNAPGYSDGGLTALQRAALMKKTECVQELLQAGADVNALPSRKRGWTALQAAAASKNTEIAHILLDADADVNASGSEEGGQTALHAAIQGPDACASKKVELVQLFLKAGADPNAPIGLQGYDYLGRTLPWYGTVLQYAVNDGNFELVRPLLDFGAKINASPGGEPQRSPIQTAAEDGNVDLVTLLLDEGADVNMAAGRTYGRTAIQAACSAEKPTIELIEVLLQAGADIHASAGYEEGLTALQGAAIRGHMRIALKLLELGADVNAAPGQVDGRMALDGAAEHGRLDMVQMLLNAGAQSEGFEETSYMWAIELADQNGHFAVARLLEARQSSPSSQSR